MATTLGAVAEGSIVYLNESGVAVPFYVAKHNYESALNGDGRTLLVRRDAWGTTMAWDAGDVNAYSGSDVDVWLNGTYKALLDSFVQTAMSTTTFYYTPGNGNLTVATLTRAVFLLSVTELEATYSYANIEGTALATASNLKIAYSNGTAVAQWTRSPYTSGVERACTLNTAGNAGGAFCSGAQRPRPAFALPASELWVDSSNNITNKKPTEPTGSYTKLEYIESSGTQFINSNYTPTENTRVVTTVRFKSTPSNNTTVFGTRSANTLQFWVFYRPNANGFAYRFGDTSDMPSVTADPTVTHVIDANKNILTVDATSTTATADTISTTYPLYLLASNNAGTAEGLASAYLYSCQIYDNNTLVRDFIPARRNSDGAIGLLDQANNVFYTNAGTGTFTAGPVAEYTWLEWIESSGTQWIDTGYKWQSGKVRTVLDFQYPSLVNSTSMFGAEGTTEQYSIVPYYRTSGSLFGVYVGTSKNILQKSGITANTDYLLEIYADDSTGTVALTLNGSTISDSYNGEVLKTYNIYLFANNIAGNASQISTMRVRSFKLYDNGAIIRDLVPAKRSDGTVGMYDKANDRFYTNGGSGVFVAGPEIVESVSMSVARVGDTQVLITSVKANVDGVEYQIGYALANVDGIEVTIPFGESDTETFVFYIDYFAPEGIEAEVGVTWREWVASEYNTINLVVNEKNHVVTANEDMVICLEGWEMVTADDEIIEGYQYKTDMY